MIYQFKSGQTFHGVDAQVAGEELERIRLINDGKLRPVDILKSAKSSRSPIHKAFTWDDEKAAHEYRLAEARQFIRAVVVVPNKGEPLPAFWNIAISVSPQNKEVEAERYYQSSEVIASSPDEYYAALQVMLRELTAAQEGLTHLRALAPRGEKLKVRRASALVSSAKEALV
jgi:hypothetical protein